MAGKFTADGIARVARRIGCDVAAVKAVIAVETNGYGFLSDGRPAILFERHVFSSRTSGKWDGLHPDLSNPVRGGYGPPDAEWRRMYRAIQLDADAAVQSASWGIGQVMGFNYLLAGEKSLTGFLLAMHHNEDAQLALMGEFIVSQGLCAAMRTGDWQLFARVYNGPAYAKNKYDTKLAKAYALHAGTPA